MSNLLSIETLVAIRERDVAYAKLKQLRSLVQEYFEAKDIFSKNEYMASIDQFDAMRDRVITAEDALRKAVEDDDFNELDNGQELAGR